MSSGEKKRKEGKRKRAKENARKKNIKGNGKYYRQYLRFINMTNNRYPVPL
jgi:hypothetical protein